MPYSRDIHLESLIFSTRIILVKINVDIIALIIASNYILIGMPSEVEACSSFRFLVARILSMLFVSIISKIQNLSTYIMRGPK